MELTNCFLKNGEKMGVGRQTFPFWVLAYLQGQQLVLGFLTNEQAEYQHFNMFLTTKR